MAKYTVQHRYFSYYNFKQLGEWQPGDVVDLEEDEAAFVQRDSPGCLVPYVDLRRAVEAAPHDRMVKKASSRQPKDRQGDPSDQGPITKADFKALKG